MEHLAEIPEDVADLVPRFLRNLRSDVVAVERALAARDIAALRRYGERFSSLGIPYGFPPITQYGRAVLNACEQGNLLSLVALPAQMRDYIERVRIVVVPRGRR